MPRIQGKIDRDGAVVRVLVAVTDIEAESLQRRGYPVPAPFATTALIDTGASQTAVAPFVVDHMKLVQSGTRELLVVGTSGRPVEEIRATYDLAISLDAPPQFSRKVEAVAAMPATSGVSLLIGRDILDQCRFLYNGEKKRFTLWF